MFSFMRTTDLIDEQWQRLEPCYRLGRSEDVLEPTTARPLMVSCMCCAPDAAGRTYPESTVPPLLAGGGLGHGSKTVLEEHLAHLARPLRRAGEAGVGQGVPRR